MLSAEGRACCRVDRRTLYRHNMQAYRLSVGTVFNAAVCCDAYDSIDDRYGMHDHPVAISRWSVASPAYHKSDRIPALVRFGRRRFVRRMLSACVQQASGISAEIALYCDRRPTYFHFTEPPDKISNIRQYLHLTLNRYRRFLQGLHIFVCF